MPRRVAIVLTTRGNYAKMKSTMRAMQARSDLTLVTLAGGGIVEDRVSDFRPQIERDGFGIDSTLDFLVEGGGTLASQTESAGRAVMQTGEALGKFAPDIIVAVADRWEALAIALAATTMNVPIAHLEGGEVSGSIDERLRHAVTKLAHLHLPANQNAADRIVRMGEDPARVVVVGTPSLDLLADIDLEDRGALAKMRGGKGAEIDFFSDYIVVSQHPVVTEAQDAEKQIMETLSAVACARLPVVWILPNTDAGRDGILRAASQVSANGIDVPVRLYASMQFEQYAVLMANARCLVGNTSSGIREAAFLGVPVVNIGTRQIGRERGHNVIDVGYNRTEIDAAIKRQLSHGRYASDPVYGNGCAGSRIVDALSRMRLDLNKSMTY